MTSANQRLRSVTASVALAGVLTMAATACSDDDSPSSASSPASGVSTERCEQNRAVGTITYLSSFDFSASAAIVDVITAKKNGYFDDLCLDVKLRSNFSVKNYPLVAAGTAQFSAAGNYTEILNQSRDGAEFIALVDYGKSPIEALITKEDGPTDLSQLRGKTIGIKGDLPPSIVALLAKAGLVRDKDYDEILLQGFDPATQLQTSIDALPVYKSNEPGQLDAKGIKYHLFDPSESNIPGSFGILYTSKEFADEHPTAVQDFTRAALRGMEDALADPEAAVAACVELLDTSGSQSGLTRDTERYRWTHESQIVLASTPDGEPVGLIDPALLATEYDTYVKAGVWPDGAPADTKPYDADVARSVYGRDGKVIWPS